MEKKRLLIITPELLPYNDLSDISKLISELPNQLAKNNYDVRILMPRFGTINERRHKLHEVVRLSGINVVFNDEDFPLMIKVASLPGSKFRLQIYFLDNDEFFERKTDFHDADGKFHEDNGDRMIFYNRGILDTVKKFGWAPDVILCHGWFCSLMPLYVKTLYNADPIFSSAQVVYKAFNKAFDGELGNDFASKAQLDGHISAADFAPYATGDHKDLSIGAMSYADAVILCGDEVEPEVTSYALKSGKPMFELKHNDEVSENYVDFLRNIQEEVNATA
jgi:starch synthase